MSRTLTLALCLMTALAATSAWAQAQHQHITPDFDSPKTGHDPKHTPKIIAPKSVAAGEWFDVTVEIGADARHPSFAEHFVRWISLSFDGVEIARTYLHPVYSSPKVSFTIALKHSGTLSASAVPNHTAEWTTERKIEVKAAPE